MALHLELTAATNIPLEVEGVTPDQVAALSTDAICRLPIYHGNRSVPLGEFFSVSGSAADMRMDWQGDLRGVHWLGAKMRAGTVHVEGPVGRHAGSEMRGGELRVEGDAGDWLGAEMRSGVIDVRGDAGHLAGAAYRGSRQGMRGGTILIGGQAGNEIGHTMRRGVIAVGGAAGDLIGFNMLAGTIVVLGPVGIRHGAGMRRGTLALLSSERPSLLPSFRYGCRFRPEVMTLLWRGLQQREFPVPPELLTCEYDLFHGDLIEGGRGEMLMACREQQDAPNDP
jgi:formylmethanofuran dehydrogenase subunit C